MPALSLRYHHCPRHKPHYLNKTDIETVAREARAQLLPAGTDALTLEQLAAIADLNINGLPYQLWVSLDHPITDEAGLPVLGLCEFDPDCGEDAVSVLISPVGEQLTPELALSTFAHELGHAVFDAPAWLVAAQQGPGLFDEAGGQHRAYRMTTRDAEHLTTAATITPEATSSAPGLSSIFAKVRQAELEKALRIAEFRANEFMGSLLVPRERLMELALAHAPEFGVELNGQGGLLEDKPKTSGIIMPSRLDNLLRELATRFGVHPRFIRVRMERYGLLATQGKTS